MKMLHTVAMAVVLTSALVWPGSVFAAGGTGTTGAPGAGGTNPTVDVYFTGAPGSVYGTPPHGTATYGWNTADVNTVNNALQTAGTVAGTAIGAGAGNYRATSVSGTANYSDWGWLGLVGLFGLAGLRGRNRDRDDFGAR